MSVAYEQKASAALQQLGLSVAEQHDAVYRAQSRVAMWMWITVGLAVGFLLFGAGKIVGRPEW